MWHYTTRKQLAGILRTGQIDLSPRGQPEPGETPVVWFSSHPLWEPTAAKRVIFITPTSEPDEKGEFDLTAEERLSTMEELQKILGLARIKISSTHTELIPFAQMVGKLMSEEFATRLEEAAVMMAQQIKWPHVHGSAYWYAIPRPVKLWEFHGFDLWDGRQWCPTQTL